MNHKAGLKAFLNFLTVVLMKDSTNHFLMGLTKTASTGSRKPAATGKTNASNASTQLEVRTSTRQWTLESATKQFNSLKPFYPTDEQAWTAARAGARIAGITVTGDGNVILVKNLDGEIVQTYNESGDLAKRIFNTDMRSISGPTNPTVIAHLHAAIAAEQEGDNELASNHYNEWINGCTFSFNILTNSSLEGKIQRGDQIKGNLEVIDGKNGELVTLKPNTIAVIAAHVPVAAKPLSADEIIAKFRMKAQD